MKRSDIINKYLFYNGNTYKIIDVLIFSKVLNLDTSFNKKLCILTMQHISQQENNNIVTLRITDEELEYLQEENYINENVNKLNLE